MCAERARTVRRAMDRHLNLSCERRWAARLEALFKLERGAGTQFDATLVPPFVALLGAN